MVEVEVTTSATTPYQYTITYSLFSDGAAISTITVERAEDNVPTTARVLSEIPNITWIDAPTAGVHTYEIRITVTGTNIASAQALTRALNAVIFG
jgi:predicted aconitase with swiveling domain